MAANSELLDSVPPHNLQAEAGVLGSILLDPRCLNEVSLILRPEDFYAKANRKIYRHLLAMDTERQPIDVSLLLERLHTVGDLEAVGGSAHLAEILNAVPYAANAVYYAKIVRDKAILRAIIHASTESLRAAYEALDDPQTVLDAAEQRLQAIGGRRDQESRTASELVLEVSDHIDAVCERGQHLGLPTGLTVFDERFGGLFAGELIILAARPSVGKSALAAQIADYASSTGRLVYFFSLEMTGRELAMRTICNIASVDGHAIRTGRIFPEDRQRLVEGMAQYARRKIVLDVRAELTVEGVGRTVRRLANEGLELAVVDYLGLMSASDRSVRCYEQVGHQTRQLKLLARETGVRLLVLCQLNRAPAEDRGAPQLHHLRESGSIEQDADTVLFIHRPEEGIMLPDPTDKSHRRTIKAEWPAELHVAKQRSGITGRIRLDWEGKYTRFSCWGNEPTRPANYEQAFDNPEEART